MQIDLTQLVIALICILISMLTSVLIPYIKSKTTADQQSQIQIWATAAVQAAEQLFQGTGRGKEKKEYVLNFLTEKGFKIDETSIDALIESSVLQLKQSISE